MTLWLGNYGCGLILTWKYNFIYQVNWSSLIEMFNCLEKYDLRANIYLLSRFLLLQNEITHNLTSCDSSKGLTYFHFNGTHVRH